MSVGEDPIKRLALDDASDEEEAKTILAIASKHSLYILIQAVCVKATREGMKVKISLSRPRRKAAKK